MNQWAMNKHLGGYLLSLLIIYASIDFAFIVINCLLNYKSLKSSNEVLVLRLYHSIQDI